MENPLDSRIPIIAQAVEDWKQQNTEDALKKKTKSLLDKHSDQIVMKLLGFKHDTWNNAHWELDHCNGRSGNSIAGEYLRSTQSEIIKDWLSRVAMPTLKPTELAKLNKDFLYEYKETYAKELYKLARESAEKDAKDYFYALVAEDALNRHLQIKNLISPDN